jgi:uncharacterized membrane protein YesL
MVTLGSPFKVFWTAAKDLFDEMLLLMLANLIWIAINLPLLGLALFFWVGQAYLLAGVAALLGLIPFAPATAALCVVAQRIAEGRVANIGLYFEGLREYWRPALAVFLPWGLILGVILVNLVFYAQLGNIVGLALLCIFLYLLFVWFSLLIYAGPLLVLQTDKRVRVVARNAFVMALGRPLFTLITLVLMGAFVVLSVYLFIPLLIVTFSFLAMWGFRATLRLVQDSEARQAAREAAQAGQPAPQSAGKGRGGQVRPRE